MDMAAVVRRWWRRRRRESRDQTANPLFQLLICRSDPKTGNTPTSVAGLGLGPALEPNCVAGVGLGAATEITTAEIEVEEAPRTRCRCRT